jgi:hypothetical protein
MDNMARYNRTDIEYSSRDLELIERKFLNTGHFHSVAAACLKIEPDYHDKAYYGSLYINDCNKVIDLDFDLDSLEGVENTIYKMKTLRDLCDQAINHIEYMKQFAVKPEKKDGSKTETLSEDENGSSN